MIKYEIIKPNFFDRFSRVKGYCGKCKKPIFSKYSIWASEGLCIYCHEIRKEGWIEGYNKGINDGLNK